jgi:hypothetical protein
MAGAIPITPTEAETRLIQRLRRHDLGALLTMLDEAGWSVARDLLRGFANYPYYQQQDTEDADVRP